VKSSTFGASGSYTFAIEHEKPVFFHTPAHTVTPVIDTTGAGDVFHGGYAYGLLQKWPLEQTTRFASVAAALKCRSLGGRKGIPTLSEINSVLG
jgi:sugar/nucleoside kinase (ribokinase family)